ncbi:spore germination protein [Alicyclobacillus ferrooxydans]|uniref:Uncharacterized protein n=1 Tax=Alicyclobacillus ferrooxydans TaxID=471514 RepID=A0A0N8PNL1_9BACL|nr:spore germination protein [Alicyclobacillus ferrooxydans]KPV41829.1 hypothetical protein AN477_20390 [Alicyclobacillus ferrooxydans]
MFRRRKAKDRYALETIRHGLSSDRFYNKAPLSKRLGVNIDSFRTVFHKASDIVFYQFTLYDNRDACLIYCEGMADSQHIDAYILQPLTRAKITKIQDSERNLPTKELQKVYLAISESMEVKTIPEGIDAIMRGYVLLLVNGDSTAIGSSIVKRKERGIEEPNTEAVIRGPREGFNENIGTSISLVRRRLPTPDLIVESQEIGLYTKTSVAILYIEGIADPEVIEELHKRLERLEMDSVIDSGYLEELIEDNPFSPFPQIQNTERPDVVAASLLEGKFAILTDGSPFALLAPINLWMSLQAAEDYYERYLIVSSLRLLRYLFLNFALLLPALYVAITTFHQEMLPTKLLLSVAAAREVTPLPAVAEALIMEITFEALREAGVRLPKTVGSAISIVGALVIGQAAVAAGIASAPMVIIVSITGIASFCIPRFNFAISIRMLRFPLIILAGTIGLFGVVVGVLAIAIHLCSLRSFGKPYLSPVTPFNGSGFLDTFVRSPRWAMGKRPMEYSKANRRRLGDGMTPKRRLPKQNQT